MADNRRRNWPELAAFGTLLLSILALNHRRSFQPSWVPHILKSLRVTRDLIVCPRSCSEGTTRKFAAYQGQDIAEQGYAHVHRQVGTSIELFVMGSRCPNVFSRAFDQSISSGPGTH
jgi:hypothetical protein